MALQPSNAIFYEQQKLKKQYDVLSKEIEENLRLLTHAENDLEQAISRRDQFALRQPPTPELQTALAPIQAAIKVKEEQIAEHGQVRCPHTPGSQHPRQHFIRAHKMQVMNRGAKLSPHTRHSRRDSVIDAEKRQNNPE